MTSNTHGELTVGHLNKAIAAHTLSLPELSDWGISRGYPALWENNDWRRRPGSFSYRLAREIRAAHQAELLREAPAAKKHRGTPPPQPVRRPNITFCPRPPSTAPQARDAEGDLCPADTISLPLGDAYDQHQIKD